METRLLVSLFVVSWAVCGAVEVTKIALIGKNYATVQDGQAQVRCTYKLKAGEGGAQISFTKNDQVIQTASAPAAVNPEVEYTSSASVDTSQRSNEGVVKCEVKTLGGHTSSKQLMVFIANTPKQMNKYSMDDMSKNKCVAKFKYASVPSDPPLETTCGIWLFDSPNQGGTDSQKGMWFDGEDMKGSYSSEEGDFTKVKAQGKLSSYKLEGVTYKLKQLPADKRMEHRCERSYVFGAGDSAVRMPVDVSTHVIQKPFKQRCADLSPHDEDPAFNMTVEHSFTGTPDCQGMWSTTDATLKATLTCEHDSSELTVECDDFKWQEVAAEGTADGKASDGDEADDDDDDAEEFVEKCRKLGSGAEAPLVSLALLVASAGILLAN